MSQTEEVFQAIRKWTEAFMRHSMRGLLAFIRNLELSPSQVNILMHLYYKDAYSVSDIAEQLGISNAAASQLIKRLERNNIVQRHEGTPDRRIRRIELTEGERRIAEDLIETRFGWLKYLAVSFSPEQKDRILRTFEELTDAVLQLEQSPMKNEA